MRFTISSKTVIAGVFLIFLIFFLIRVGNKSTQQQRKQEISQTAASTINENIREIRITAKQFSFTPDVITLKLNENVRFRITSEDVTHGFSLPEFNINEVIEPGKETVVDFHSSKKGRFTFLCSVQCGTGHSGMRGSIVIK